MNTECLLRVIYLKRLRTSTRLSVRTTDNPVENITEYIANTNREHYHDTNIFRKQIKTLTQHQYLEQKHRTLLHPYTEDE